MSNQAKRDLREALEALRQWEYWYDKDSTEFLRDTARDEALKVLKRHKVCIDKPQSKTKSS